MEILRNMWRRKFRSFLTIMGISIGILAFTVMGSLALKLNKMIAGGKSYITGQITIMPKGTDFMTGGTSTLPLDILNKISKIDGIEAVTGGVSLSVDEPNPDDPIGGGGFSQPATIYSVERDSNFKNKNWTTLPMKSGNMIDKTSNPYDIVVGRSVALDKKWNVGDKVTVRGREFNVVGILDKTMTGPDSYVFMDLGVARELFVESNPFLKSLKDQSEKASKLSSIELAKLPADVQEQLKNASTFKMEDISTSASVSWEDGQDSNKLAEKIKNDFKNNVLVLSPEKMGEQIDKASAQMNAIILGAALLALIVGLFSIVNTMVMSISERTKEIGIKKAIGASNGSIAREYTLEAGVLSLVGGLFGMGLGVLIITLINNKMASKGAEIFLIQSNFLIGVVVFSFVIGIVAGVLPALRASKLRVVEAIREL